MKKVTQLRQNEQKDDTNSGPTNDELSQVRELLFGGTVRELERQRQSLQSEVNAGFEKADQITEKRLNELSKRLDKLDAAQTEESRLRHDSDTALNKLIISNLDRLKKHELSTQTEATQTAKRISEEVARVDAVLKANVKQRDELLKSLTSQLNKRIDTETQQLTQHVNTASTKWHQSLTDESARIDDALAHQALQVEASNKHLQKNLESSVANERKRIAEALRGMASIIAKEQKR